MSPYDVGEPPAPGRTGRTACSPIASRTVPRHLLRGAVGAALLAWAVGSASVHPILAITTSLSALVALRGCPLCWTIGLVETVIHRRRRA